MPSPSSPRRAGWRSCSRGFAPGARAGCGAGAALRARSASRGARAAPGCAIPPPAALPAFPAPSFPALPLSVHNRPLSRVPPSWSRRGQLRPRPGPGRPRRQRRAATASWCHCPAWTSAPAVSTVTPERSLGAGAAGHRESKGPVLDEGWRKRLPKTPSWGVLLFLHPSRGVLESCNGLGWEGI